MALSDERLKAIIEVWKKVVDVQQHFNDLALRIRNFALSAFTFIVAAVGFLLKEDIAIMIFTIKIPAASLMCFAGILILIAFWFMDRYWYYNLLIGAVTHGEFIEDKYEDEFPELGLAKQIRKSSPTIIFKKKLHSRHKFNFFYGIMWITLLVLGILAFSKPNEGKSETKATTLEIEVSVKKDSTLNSSVTTNLANPQKDSIK